MTRGFGDRIRGNQRALGLGVGATAAVVVGVAVALMAQSGLPQAGQASPSAAIVSGAPQATATPASSGQLPTTPNTTPEPPPSGAPSTPPRFTWPPRADDVSDWFLYSSIWAVSTVDNLNVRSGPGTEHPGVGQVDKGDLVLVIEGGETEHSWAHVAGDGLVGWANVGPADSPWLAATPTPWKSFHTRVEGVASDGSSYLAFGISSAHDYQPYEGGNAALLLQSIDGVTWTDVSEGLQGGVVSLAAGPTGWVALSGGSGGPRVASFSVDGRTWSFQDIVLANGVGYGPKGWVAVGLEGAWRSADGRSWQGPVAISGSAEQAFSPDGLEASDTGYVAFARDPARVWSSMNGRTWEPVEMPREAMIADVELVGDKLLVVLRRPATTAAGARSFLLRATLGAGGVTWDTPINFEDGLLVDSVSQGTDGLLALGWDNDALVPVLWRSADGASWERVDVPPTVFGGAVGPEPAWGPAGWIALGGGLDGVGQQLWRSADGGTWNPTGNAVALTTRPPCPPEREVSTIVLIYLAPFANECFGEASLTIRGRVPVIEGLGGCCWPVSEPGWLAGKYAGGYITSAGRVLVPGVLALYLPPQMNADALREGGWVEVVGHFRDEAAETCRRTPLPLFPGHRLESQATVRRDCEQRFVVESIKAIDGP
jgi:hypothetical protein